MEPIKFYIGQESGIVVENKDFDKSLFVEQYKQAFEIFNTIWDAQTKEDFRNASNIIAFCGDRGEGKTSLLTSVRAILRGGETYKSAKESLILSEHAWNPKDILALDIIDPLFFDNKHNLIDLLLGQMIVRLEEEERCRQERENFDVKRVELKNKLIQSFQRAKECLKALNVDGNKNAYDELENLDDLASGINLKKELDNLFEYYNAYFGTKRLVICIDDLDLNMSEGYKMSEQMRKYLCYSKYCILLAAVKVEQMTSLIASTIREQLKGSIVSNEAILNMADRYVTKLLPLSNRILLPTFDDLCRKELEVRKEDKPYVGDVSTLLLPEYIVRLIFGKTRYLFYNASSVSPIVPTNLRSLRLLMKTLQDMSSAKNNLGEDNKENKRLFKSYFFFTWTNCLNNEDQVFVRSLYSYDDVVSINKYVISYLVEKYRDVLNVGISRFGRDNEGDTITKDILNKGNMSFHISIGDVFYVLDYLSKVNTDTGVKLLVFFLQSYYSMKLYELYDELTESLNKSNKKKGNETEQRLKVTVNKKDLFFEGMSLLQRLVHGSYFTFERGNIIVKQISKDDKKMLISLDRKVIDGKQLVSEMESVITHIDDLSEKSKKDENVIKALKNMALRCEFFMLTITNMVAANKLKSKDFGFSRLDAYPRDNHKLRERNYYEFNVLSIFANLLNIDATYERFDFQKAKNFVEYIKKQPWSLYQQIFKQTTGNKECCKNGTPSVEEYHRLLSDATIRISEVQNAIVSELIKNRIENKYRDKADSPYKIKMVYQTIQNLGIQIYPIDPKSPGYPIDFKFLTPIIEYLKEEYNDEFEKILILNPNQELAIQEVISSSSIYEAILTDAVLNNLSYPVTGNVVKEVIKNNNPTIWQKGIFISSRFWSNVFHSSASYSSLKDVYNVLAAHATNLAKIELPEEEIEE